MLLEKNLALVLKLKLYKEVLTLGSLLDYQIIAIIKPSLRVFLCLKVFNAMINESDKSLFRSTVDHQQPVDKDSSKESNAIKTKPERPFKNYSSCFSMERKIWKLTCMAGGGNPAIAAADDAAGPAILADWRVNGFDSLPVL